MNIEQYLENLRKGYLKTVMPSFLVENGWNQIREKLQPRQPKNSYFFSKGIAFICLFILIMGGSLGITQAAKPNTLLYPVKILSDNALAKITGKPEMKIERRAQDVIKMTQNDPEDLEKAAQEYTKVLEELSRQKNDPQDRENLKRTLTRQEEKLDQTLKSLPATNPKAEKVLQRVIQQTKEATGEVKGVKSKDQAPKGNRKNKN